MICHLSAINPTTDRPNSTLIAHRLIARNGSILHSEAECVSKSTVARRAKRLQTYTPGVLYVYVCVSETIARR